MQTDIQSCIFLILAVTPGHQCVNVKDEPSTSRNITKQALDRLPMGVLEDTYLTHTFLLKETKTGEMVALFQTNNDASLINTLPKPYQLYVDYVEHNGNYRK